MPRGSSSCDGCSGVCDRLWSVRASEVGFADRHRPASTSRLGAAQQASAAHWNRRSRGVQARALFTPTTHCLRSAICGRASAKTPPPNARAFRPPKAWQIVHATQASRTKPRAACPCRPVRRPRRPFIPRTLRLSAAAQAARASGCRSSAASQVWAGLLQDQHHIRSTACQACTANRPHRTASANARQIRRTSRGHWKRPALKTDTAR